MKILLSLLFVLLLSASQVSNASTQFTINGNIKGEHGDGIANVKVVVNGLESDVNTLNKSKFQRIKLPVKNKEH